MNEARIRCLKLKESGAMGLFFLMMLLASCNVLEHRAVPQDPKEGATETATKTKKAVVALSDPVFVSISPASPSNISLTPKIIGTSDANAKLVVFYSTSDCSGAPIGSGTNDDFIGTGAPAFVSPNSTTIFYAESVGATKDEHSSCVLMTTFVNDMTPPTIAFTSLTPVGPSGNATPVITGTIDADTTNVTFSSDALCTQHIGSGSTPNFTSTGVTLTVPHNVTTQIYAQSSDAAGNPSLCTLLTSYLQDDPPTTAPFSPAAFNEDTQSGVITLGYTDAAAQAATSCALSSLTHVTVTQACACTAGVCTARVTGTSNYHGAASFQYSVTGVGGTSNLSTVSLTINSVDDPPVATNISPAAFNEDVVSGTITLAYSDADGDLATACTVSNLQHVTVSQACSCTAGTCTVKVLGVSNYHGAASFDYTVTANSVVSNTATASLTINSVDDAPVASNLSPAAMNEESQSALITLSYSDVEGDLATSCALSNLNGVTESLACTCDGAGVCTVKVTGNAGFYGAASFDYTVTSNGLSSNVATASFTINPILYLTGLKVDYDAAYASAGAGPHSSGADCLDSFYGSANDFDPTNPATFFTSLVGSGSCSTSGYRGNGSAGNPYSLLFSASSGDKLRKEDSTVVAATLTHFSYEMWVKPTTASGTSAGYFSDTANNYYQLYDNQTGLVFDVSAPGISATVGPVSYTTAWNHWMLTVNGSAVDLYLNGSLKASTTLTSALPDSLMYPTFGTAYDSNLGQNVYLDGKLAISRVYDSALTAAQVLQNCDAFKSRFSGATCAP